MSRRWLAAALAAACGCAPGLLSAQQQANPAGTAAEQRREDRDRAGVPGKSDWERQHEEDSFKESDEPMPAYPKKEGLVEFRISNPGSFRYFIDTAALSIGADEVVRYTLVVRSNAGVENVSYEGMRCQSSTYKVFAYGNDGKWSPVRTDWRETTLRWEYELRTRYLCPMKQRVRTPAEALDALKRGGHPSLVNSGS
ncbi:MAG: CNP1-like family protein [Burkholderiales bacterium]